MGCEWLDVVDAGLALARDVAPADDAGEVVADQRGAARGLPFGGIVKPGHKMLCLPFARNVKRKLPGLRPHAAAVARKIKFLAGIIIATGKGIAT